MRKILLTYFFILCGLLAISQESNFYITNFTPASYGTSDQNWSVTQDSLGRIYVANLSGVMFYDGEYWKVITIGKANNQCISLAKSADETIFVGSNGEFGYLDFSDNDSVLYKPLSDKLSENEKEFGNVWSIQAIGNDVFFCSNEKIFWYKNKEFKKSFKPTGEKFHTFFSVNNTLLVREQGVGLSFFKDGALHKILGTGELSNVRVYSVLPLKDNLYWLCSRNGMYALYFNANKPEISNLVKLNSSIDKWMSENDIYCGVKLNDGVFALGSLKKGILLINDKLQIVNTINYDKGLQDDAIKFIYKDLTGNIWLALNKGISYVDINSPITFFGKSNNVNSTIESVAKFKNNLYIATDKGVSKFDKLTNSFIPTDITDQSWDLVVVGDVLLAGTSGGIYKITEKGTTQFNDVTDIVKKIFVLPDKKHLYLANAEFMHYVNYNEDKITIEKTFDYATSIESFGIDTNNCKFFGTSSDIIYVHDPKRPDTLISLSIKSHIKTTNTQVNVSKCGKSVIFISDEAILTPVGYPDIKIIRDKRFDIPELSRTIFYNCLPVRNEVWFTTTTISDIFNLKEDPIFTILDSPSGAGSKYSIKKHHFLYRIRGVSKIHCNFIDTSVVYLGSENGLFMYDLSKTPSFSKFNTFISRVKINNDSVNFLENYTALTKVQWPEIKYKNNKITFFFSASDFYNVKLLEFSYYLEGKDNSYGPWTLTNNINYSNLSEGTYVLHLKSRNILGVEGEPVNFTFVILPPWYRTYWAYALYFLGSVGLIWFIVQFNIKRLKEQNIKLEKIIAERTKEVELQKEEIEHKNQEITDSINYAKRIQQAILPPIPDIKRAWTNSFVFFQPKDIVSGDFYWFNKVNDNEMLIACCDCTGHGVPGGFMSMICSDKLNEAVKTTTDPAEILYHVNNNVKLALRQHETADENVNKDGMEIALVKINFAQKKIWYAGANRPLWLLKTTAIEIEEVKPTKASIASFTAVNFTYQAHEIQLDKGDLVYMTSDGYPDQFGGQDGKKFMTKNFKKLILSIKDLAIPEQETTIKNIINQWMSGYEQVDDLLVIGFRI